MSMQRTQSVFNNHPEGTSTVLQGLALNTKISDNELSKLLADLNENINNFLSTNNYHTSNLTLGNMSVSACNQLLDTLEQNAIISAQQVHLIKHNLHLVAALPFATQIVTIKHVLQSITAEIDNGLKNKSTSSSKVSAIKTFLSVIDGTTSLLQHISTRDDGDGSITSTNLLLGTSQQPPSAFIFTNSSAPNTGPDLSNMDGPTAALFAMIWMAESPLSNEMNINSTQIVTLGNNASVISTTSNQMNNILSFFTNNPNGGANGTSTSVSLFNAFYYWMQANYPNSSLGPAPTNDPDQDIDQAFASDSSMNSLFQSMYNTLQTVNENPAMAGVTITPGLLAAGDAQPWNGIVNPTNIQNYPQQIFMSNWVQPVNAAGYAISGLNSSAIFSSTWSTVSNAQDTPYLQPGGSGTNYLFTFSMSNIVGLIGASSTSGNSGGTGVLAATSQAQTTSNTTNSALMATQTYLGNQFSNLINTAISVLNDLKFQF